MQEANKKSQLRFVIGLVGMTRFELATPRPPDVCATGLRYIPNLAKIKQYFIRFPVQNMIIAGIVFAIIDKL